MKKLLVLLLALTMLLSFAACEKKDSAAGSAGTASSEEGPADTPAKMLRADFRKIVAENSSATPEEIASKIMENPEVKFMSMVMPVEPGLLTGFGNTEITGFKSGALFGPAIGTIPFIGYIFQLDDGVDASAFVETLRSSGDMRWNICTEAEELIAENSGNLVFFVMAPAKFEEEPME